MEMKQTILNKTFGDTNEKQVSVKLNRYAKGQWVVGTNGITHEWEISLDNGNGHKVVSTMRATINQAKKLAEKYLIQEYIYLNPTK